MTVIATGTSVTETNGPPPRKKICLSLSGKGRTYRSLLPVATTEADTGREMSVTVNRVDANKRRTKRSLALQSDRPLRRDALTGSLESGNK